MVIVISANDACTTVRQKCILKSQVFQEAWSLGVSFLTFFFSECLISTGFPLFHLFNEVWCPLFPFETDIIVTCTCRSLGDYRHLGGRLKLHIALKIKAVGRLMTLSARQV